LQNPFQTAGGETAELRFSPVNACAYFIGTISIFDYIGRFFVPATGGKMKAWWVFALLSSFFAALTAILAKIGIKGVDSDLATAIRTVVILVIAWGIVVVKGQGGGLGSVSRHSLLFIVLSGVATGLSWIFYFRALQLGRVSQVAPLDKASLGITILLSVIFLGETLSWKTAVGAGLILLGTITLIL
jgi:transporter family protein